MSRIFREFLFPSGPRFQLAQGDLTLEAVDAIVNAANRYLAHGGGLAAAILRRGGDVIQAESDAWVREHGPVSHAEPALRLYLAERPASTISNCAFLSYQLQGLSTTAIHYRLMRYREQAAVHLTAHRLRHCFANDLLSAGAPVTSIQQLLGHRWLETTQIYVAANDQQVAEDYFAASQKLEGWSLCPPSA